MNNIEKVIFLKSIENGKEKVESCIFYSDQTLKYTSYEEGTNLLTDLVNKDNTNLKDLKSYDKVDFLSKKEFENKYKLEIENRKRTTAFQKYLKSFRQRKEVGQEEKSRKSSLLDKISIKGNPIKKIALIGFTAFMCIAGFKVVEAVTTTEEPLISSLEIDDSNLDEEVNYVLVKDKKEVEEPLKVTINKEEEEEHTELESQENKKRIKFIKYYSGVYNLNKNKVIKIIKNKTKLLSYKSLNKKTNNKKIEFKILNTVKDISENASTYKKKYGEIKKISYKKKKTYRKMVRHYADLYGIDANKALAIEFLESGHYEQPIATEKHNPGSKKRSDGEYYSYQNMEQGIIEHMITLCNYKGQSIEEMAARYCSEKGAAGWSGQVRPIYNHLEKDPNYYTLVDEKAPQKVKK